MKPLQLTFILIGLYIVAEGLASFIVFADQNPLFEAGRIIRVVFGIFIILFASRIKG